MQGSGGQAGREARGRAGGQLVPGGPASAFKSADTGRDNVGRSEGMGCFKHLTSARYLNTKNVTSVVDGGLRTIGDDSHTGQGRI